MKPYLIIARVGDRSLHGHWIKDSNRLFDVFLSYYGEQRNRYSADAQIYHQQKGAKWPVIYQHIKDHWQLVSQYQAVWLPDDDLMADTSTVNKMFAFFTAFDLQLAQPALTTDSYCAHPALFQQPDSLVRFCNFVEVMAPLVSVNCLPLLLDTFSESQSGWGLDFVWPRLIDNDTHMKIGIIDAASVTHTRPIGGDLYKKNPELSPRADIEKLIKIYDERGVDIRKRSKNNKFRIFAQVELKRNKTDWRQYLAGKRDRLAGKKIIEKGEKYPQS